MKYTLHHLEVFVKICETKSITVASELLHLTQPAVSIQLKNFQNQFDIPLTEVIGKKLYITAFGLEIAEVAKNILNEVDAINNKTLAYKGMAFGKLKISVVSTGKYVIPYFLSKFLDENEGVELQLDVTNKAKVIKNLENNEVDFSLVSLLPKHLEINKLTLMKNELYMIGNSKKNYQEDLEKLTFLYREKGSATRLAMENYLEKKQISLKRKITLTSNEAVKQAIIAGLGVSIMPIIGLKNELLNKDLTIIPTEGLPIVTNWNVIWLKQKKLTPVAQLFLKFLEKEKNEIMNDNFYWIKNIK